MPNRHNSAPPPAQNGMSKRVLVRPALGGVARHPGPTHFKGGWHSDCRTAKTASAPAVPGTASVRQAKHSGPAVGPGGGRRQPSCCLYALPRGALRRCCWLSSKQAPDAFFFFKLRGRQHRRALRPDPVYKFALAPSAVHEHPTAPRSSPTRHSSGPSVFSAFGWRFRLYPSQHFPSVTPRPLWHGRSRVPRNARCYGTRKLSIGRGERSRECRSKRYSAACGVNK